MDTHNQARVLSTSEGLTVLPKKSWQSVTDKHIRGINNNVLYKSSHSHVPGDLGMKSRALSLQ